MIMADKTGIEWTGSTWTPFRARNLENGKRGWHCEKVSAGCDNCYAAALNKRYGTGLPFKPGHRKDIEIFLDENMLLQPLKWKKPRKIFVCSTTDLFADFHTDEMIDRVFAVVALCPQHTFQVLTKRSKRMRDYILADRCDLINGEAAQFSHWDAMPQLDEGPLKNLWLGVSAEDQATADERIPDLLETPAAVRFVSAEPLLSEIDFSQHFYGREKCCADCPRDSDCDCAYLPKHMLGEEPYVSWVICGGESGPGYRPMEIEWAESVRQQCQNTSTPFFFKQDSGARSGMRGNASDDLWSCKEFPS
jgi:protein gp37